MNFLEYIGSTFVWQSVYMLMLGLIPLCWLSVMHGGPVHKEVSDGNMLTAAKLIYELRHPTTLMVTGMALFCWGSIYQRLPFKIIPRVVPILGRIDSFAAKLMCLAGVGCAIAGAVLYVR